MPVSQSQPCFVAQPLKDVDPLERRVERCSSAFPSRKIDKNDSVSFARCSSPGSRAAAAARTAASSVAAA